MRYLAITLSLMFFSLQTPAQVFKWTDEKGKVQYSDQPPLANTVRDEQKIKIHAAPTPVQSNPVDDDENADQPKTLADERQEYDKRRQERKEKEAQQRAEAEQNKQKCVDARSRLRVFLESPRLRMPDGKGGLVYIDDDTRQQKINEANKAIAAYCK